MRVCRDLGVNIGALQEEQLAFCLRNNLAPQMEWECLGGAAEDANEVVLSGLNRLFGDVATMVVGRHKLVRHIGGFDFRLVGR